jgi:invasion protein IalB
MLAAFLAASCLSSAAFAQEQARFWGTNCISLGRTTASQCSMNHAVSLQETGQLVFNVVSKFDFVML